MPLDKISAEAFRAEVRAFIAERLPETLRARVAKGGYVSSPELRPWIAALAERGWSAPSWPREHDGAALPPRLRAILDEECALADAPPVEGLGFSTVGPAIIEFGSEAQKARFLPPIVSGAEFWCQGFSEPEAGSDLAAIRTRGRREGDLWRVSGSKIWTSDAHNSDWMLCLVRSDPEAGRHQGITALLIDMRARGVTVRPIRWMNGVHGFNQVFLDDVEVPDENRLGGEGEGWAVAMHALGPERIFVSRVAENKRLQKRLREAMALPLHGGARAADDAEFAARAARLEVRLLALEERFLRFLDDLEAGRPVGPEVSMLKLTGSRLIQRFEALIAECYGPAALPFDAERTAAVGLGLEIGPPAAAMSALRLLHHRGYTIAAGSSEVQLEVLSRRVLGL